MSAASRFCRLAAAPLLLGACVIGLSAPTQQADETCSAVGEQCVDGPAASEELSLLQRTGGGRGHIGDEAADMLPKPLREEDFKELRLFQMKNTPEAEDLSPSQIKVPAGWAGPLPRLPPGQDLWGGPPASYASQRFGTKVIPSDDVENFMNFAGPDSGFPEDMQGIFWMDQGGVSAIAKDDMYPHHMVASPEVLASFGTASTPPGPGPGTHFEADSKCITPVLMYGGRQWTGYDDISGDGLLRHFGLGRNTISFCYTDANTVQLYIKMLTSEASIGPVKVGAKYAALMGFVDAGGGYSWAPHAMLNMTMKKMSWGWDRITTLVGGKGQRKLSRLEEYLLKKVLPPNLWNMYKSAKKMSSKDSHYPLIQIVDGKGNRTQYYDEFLKFMHSRADGGKTLRMAVPEDEADPPVPVAPAPIAAAPKDEADPPVPVAPAPIAGAPKDEADPPVE